MKSPAWKQSNSCDPWHANVQFWQWSIPHVYHIQRSTEGDGIGGAKGITNNGSGGLAGGR